MALPVPNLDDRRFQDLVDDAKRMVQRRCPEWTDHNVSDPGVTLIETFAFMTDQLLFRLNQVPDRMYVKFFEMIGLRLLAATPAKAPVTFWLSAPAVASVGVAAGTTVATPRTDSYESTIFTTRDDLQIIPCSLQDVATISDGEYDGGAAHRGPEDGDVVPVVLRGAGGRRDPAGRAGHARAALRRPPRRRRAGRGRRRAPGPPAAGLGGLDRQRVGGVLRQLRLDAGA